MQRRLGAVAVHLRPAAAAAAAAAASAAAVAAAEQQPLTVAVLGGTGHIGSYLCPRLAAAPEKYRCICVSRSTTSAPYAAAGGSWAGAQKLLKAIYDRSVVSVQLCPNDCVAFYNCKHPKVLLHHMTTEHKYNVHDRYVC